MIALAAASTAGGQNLNPTVEVTNQFVGKVMEVTKPGVEMAVPDSLLRFDLEFDYSVFDTPYKGTYEFSPYLLDIKPERDTWRGNGLYLRLGAGYALHPTADLVYSPDLSGPFRLNVYGTHRSYVGDYKVRLGSIEADLKGYDMLSRAGVDGRYDYASGAFTFDAGYYGIHTKLAEGADAENSAYNALDVKLRARSLAGPVEHFHYDVTAAFRGASQRYTPVRDLSTVDFNLDATAGPVFSDGHGILTDIHVGINSYSGLFSASTGILWVAPKYVLNANRWRIAAGVRAGTVIRSGDAWMGYVLGGQKGQFVYPDFRIGYEAVTDRLNLYVAVTGGDHVRSYSVQKEDNHFFNPLYGRNAAPLADNSVERIRASVGMQGNIASKFRYDVRGGWLYVTNGLLDAVRAVRDDIASAGSLAGRWVGSVAYEDYAQVFADADFVYDGRPVSVSGGIHFVNTDMSGLQYGFAPASTGRLEIAYNKMDRIRAGVRAEGALERAGGTDYRYLDLTIPGYVDLGLFGEYAVTRNLSLWLRADNLLNANIQRHPLCPESGISVTGGIIFCM